MCVCVCVRINKVLCCSVCVCVLHVCVCVCMFGLITYYCIAVCVCVCVCVCALLPQTAKQMANLMMITGYTHLPFCASKCVHTRHVPQVQQIQVCHLAEQYIRKYGMQSRMVTGLYNN